MFWNNMNISLLTILCINKEALCLLVSQAERFLPSTWPGLLLFPTSSLHSLMETVHMPVMTPDMIWKGIVASTKWQTKEDVESSYLNCKHKAGQ